MRPYASSSDRRRGTVVLLLASFAFVALGLLALGIDLGRMYVARNELQNFADAAALRAIYSIDGTTSGLQAARDKAVSGPNRWNFGLEAPAQVTVEFATTSEGPFEETPPSGAGYSVLRVTAQASVPLSFAQIFPGVGSASTVAAAAVAAQQPLPGLGDGVLPFSPDAHDPNDVTGNYGFLLGRYYTLRYDNLTGSNSPAGGYKTSIDGVDLVGCDADMASPSFQPGETSNSQRGYIDLADLGPLSAGGGSDLLRGTILSTTSFVRTIEPYNYWIAPEPGEKQKILTAVQDRVLEDTDPVTPRYYAVAQTAPGTPSREMMNSLFRDATTYRVDEPRPPYGNGRRIGVVPVNDPRSSGIVIGFAGFFLPPNPCAEVKIANKKYYPCCAEYIGPVSRFGGASGASGGGAFQVVLVR